MEVERLSREIPLVQLSEAYWSDRGAFLAHAYAQFGPVFRARHLKTEVIFLIGPAANRFLLATERASFSNALGWGWVFGNSDEPRNLLTMDPPDHPTHRKILAPAFVAPSMPRYFPLIQRVVERRLARWAHRVEVEAYEESRIIAFDLAVRAFLGLQPGPEVELGRSVYLHGAGGRASAFQSLLRRKIHERREKACDDALGLLCSAADEQGQPLSDAQVLAHAEILLVAGYETTASMGAWALYLLAAHPEWAERVRTERERAVGDGILTLEAMQRMPDLDHLVLETERLYPPVPTAPRTLLQDVEFEGYRIPEGALVFYSPAGTHMLSECWSSPDHFDPERFTPSRVEHRKTAYSLVGFGGGPRMCIGQSFARLQLRLVVAEATRYRLAVAPDQTLMQRYGVTTRPLHGIRLQVLNTCC